MSLGLFLPTIALLGAAPEQPVAVPELVPFAQVDCQAQVQAPAILPTPPPAPDTNIGEPPAVANEPAITLDPLTDPATEPASTEPAPAAGTHHAPGDSLEGFNRRMFAGHQSADRKILRPAAMGYRHVVPKPMRSVLRHFFSNLGEPIVFLNDLLQLKPGRASRTFARFAINSTLGIGGLIDVAKEPNLKLLHHDNGFGNTLGYYGVGPGPYLFLPFVGPTTLRDFIGGQGDGLILPVSVGKPFDRWQYQVPKGVITGLDLRAESDADLKALFDGAIDPYATLRSVYLQNRAAEIEALHSRGHKKKATTSPLDDPLGDPAAQQASPLDDPLSDPAAAPSATPDAAPPPAVAPMPATP